MSTRLSLDRFEGKGKQIAVLVADDGATLNVPKSLLPAGAKPGDVLSFSLSSIRGRPPSSRRRPGVCRTICRSATRVGISSCDR